MNKIIHPIEPEELTAYLDGEFTADRASATAAHLSECTECQNIVAELRSISQNLQSWKTEPPESAMPSAVATALAKTQTESRNAFRVPKATWRELLRQRWPAFAWAGTAAAVLVLVFQLGHDPKPAPFAHIGRIDTGVQSPQGNAVDLGVVLGKGRSNSWKQSTWTGSSCRQPGASQVQSTQKPSPSGRYRSKGFVQVSVTLW